MWLYDRWRAVAIFSVVIVCMIVGALILQARSSGSTRHAKTMTTMTVAQHTTTHPAAMKGAAMKKTAMKSQPSGLLQTVDKITMSGYAHGFLPQSSCHAMSATEVVCKQPHYAIDEVAFQKFPSLPMLYSAYVARVKVLAGGRYRTNYGDCNPSTEFGERSWNHHFKHPTRFALAPFISGKIQDEQAVGRVFCALNGGIQYIVWTQNDGRLLNEVAGSPHSDTYVWWLHVHHVISTPGMPNMMGMGMGK